MRLKSSALTCPPLDVTGSCWYWDFHSVVVMAPRMDVKNSKSRSSGNATSPAFRPRGSVAGSSQMAGILMTSNFMAVLPSISRRLLYSRPVRCPMRSSGCHRVPMTNTRQWGERREKQSATAHCTTRLRIVGDSASARPAWGSSIMRISTRLPVSLEPAGLA